MKILKKITLTLLVVLGITLGFDTMAQGVPNPPSGGHGQGGNQNGGNAPIGGGLFILIGLGAAYGGKKLYQSHKDNLEE